MRFHILAIPLMVLPLTAYAQQAHHDHASAYMGEEMREIKSLSAEDIAELKRGGGWGFAKTAELNGIPGPSHVLAMKQELALTPSQLQLAQEVFEKMQRSAIQEGERLIAAERDLESAFQSGSINESGLHRKLGQIEQSRATLRFIHLSAHLEMKKLLDRHQVEKYNELRGYAAR
ncbi:MAG: hypothetical protein QHC90_05095 [Shinella sp.]|nr:hypothetical protein [Shinella sp.]